VTATSPIRGLHRRISPRARLLADLADLDAQIGRLREEHSALAGELVRVHREAQEAAAGREKYAAALARARSQIDCLEGEARAKRRLELAVTSLTSQLADARRMHQLGATSRPGAEELAAGRRTRADTVEMPAAPRHARPEASPAGWPWPADTRRVHFSRAPA
jgi:chromosome segregation ATPase